MQHRSPNCCSSAATLLCCVGVCCAGSDATHLVQGAADMLLPAEQHLAQDKGLLPRSSALTLVPATCCLVTAVLHSPQPHLRTDTAALPAGSCSLHACCCCCCCCCAASSSSSTSWLLPAAAAWCRHERPAWSWGSSEQPDCSRMCAHARWPGLHGDAAAAAASAVMPLLSTWSNSRLAGSKVLLIADTRNVASSSCRMLSWPPWHAAETVVLPSVLFIVMASAAFFCKYICTTSAASKRRHSSRSHMSKHAQPPITPKVHMFKWLPAPAPVSR